MKTYRRAAAAVLRLVLSPGLAFLGAGASLSGSALFGARVLDPGTSPATSAGPRPAVAFGRFAEALVTVDAVAVTGSGAVAVEGSVDGALWGSLWTSPSIVAAGRATARITLASYPWLRARYVDLGPGDSVQAVVAVVGFEPSDSSEADQI